MHKPELLAPVGSKEALIAAVENGADAVYFGGTAFSARQYAPNFTREELEWAVDYAHVRGVKAYVTMNTLIKDSELEEACEYLQFLCNAGADAVIVQDTGILRLLREQLPELPVHASTQMTIHNIEGVKFLQEMGVKRVVLARELSLQNIRKIKAETNIEIETFVHGALCFSYSGQCLLSSMIGGRSGNRGYCAQPCRKKYRINGAEGYLLSPRDLNMSEHIPGLVKAGIDSFKIEGRMKRPEYVAGVVGIYRKLIERYFEEPEGFQVTANEKHTLLQLFNRGFTIGYFFRNPGSELMSWKYPHNIGTEIGTVAGYDNRKKLLSLNLKAWLRVGDGIGIGGGDGIVVRSMYVNNRRINEAGPGLVKIPFDIEVNEGSVVFKTYDSRLMASLESKDIRKIPVKLSVKARIGEPVELCINDGKNEIIVHGGIVSRAESRPISKESMAAQLKKLGDTVFEAQEIAFDLDETIFIPVSLLNELRRKAVAGLEAERVQKWKRRCKKPEIATEKRIAEVKPILAVHTSTIEGFKAAVDSGADVVYIGGGVFGNKEGEFCSAIEYAHKKGVTVFLSTPRIVKEIKDLNTKLGFDGFLVSNLGILYYLSKFHEDRPITIDYPLNVFNRLTMSYLLGHSKRVTLSPELTLDEIRNLTQYGSTECIVHGNFPLMVSEHDLVGSLFPWIKDALLKDEKGFSFPARTDMLGRTYVMNSRELCMFEYLPEIMEAGVECLRIEAGTYDAAKTGEITRAYREAMDTRTGKPCSGEYTTGHYFRGVL
ncbi:Peptidase family U32 [uncultured archaeon]|nr:Peptidase family U32 [uncultured archaeon]